MALTFKEIEKFKFGDLEVVPQMTTELKLRVQNLELKEENLDEIRTVLSSCFGDKAGEVKAFMEKNLFLLDYTKIQLYLTQGQSGLDALEKRMSKLIDKQVDKALEDKTVNG